MTYAPTDWVDGITPVDAAHMDKIEGGIVAAVEKDSVVPGGTRLLQSSLLLADAQPAFKIQGSGRIDWGPGGAGALDTSLFRLAAKVLQTDSRLVFMHTAGSDTALQSQIPADSDERFRIRVNGEHTWGPGNAAADTNLYRAAASTLQTDGHFKAANISAMLAPSDTQPQIVLARNYQGAGLPGIVFGVGSNSNPDVSLYRSGPAQIATNSHFTSAGTWACNLGLAGQVATGSNGIMYWGLAADTNLYRASADLLKTDDALQVAGTLYLGALGDTFWQRYAANYIGTTNHVWLAAADGVDQKVYFSSLMDTTLYRSAVGTLKTDGQLNLGRKLLVGVGGTQAEIYFGSASDTVLYRASAAVLATDGSLSWGGFLMTTKGGTLFQLDGTAQGGFTLPGSASSCSQSIRVYIAGVPYKIPVYPSA